MNDPTKRVYSLTRHRNRQQATTLRVTLEDAVAVPLREAQRDHPALVWPDGRRPTISLMTRRALVVYLQHLGALHPEKYADELAAIKGLS